MKLLLTFLVEIEIPEEYQDEALKAVNKKFYFPTVTAQSSIITEALNTKHEAFELIDVTIN